MTLTIISPFLFGIFAFITCALIYRFLPRLLRRLRQKRVKVTGPLHAEAIRSIRASLADIYQQLEDSPVVDSGPQKKSAIGILYRCGIPGSDIADQLRLSRSEVDLTIQVDRHRAQRKVQERGVTHSL
jgi:hypothetical protein